MCPHDPTHKIFSYFSFEFSYMGMRFLVSFDEMMVIAPFVSELIMIFGGYVYVSVSRKNRLYLLVTSCKRKTSKSGLLFCSEKKRRQIVVCLLFLNTFPLWVFSARLIFSNLCSQSCGDSQTCPNSISSGFN